MTRKSLVLTVTLTAAITSLAAIAGPGAQAGKPKKPVTRQSADLKWIPLVPELGAKGPQISVVFGDIKKGPVGLLLKDPAGARPGLHTHTSDYWGVVVSGTVQDFAAGEGGSARDLGAGSWWMQPGKAPHDNYCREASECVVFVYFPKGFDFAPVAAAHAAR